MILWFQKSVNRAGKTILLTRERLFLIINTREANVSLEKRKRVIFHIDVNSAYLSWEAVYRLYHLGGRTDLREEVSAVGGDAALRHGIILAKSIPASLFNKDGKSASFLFWIVSDEITVVLGMASFCSCSTREAVTTTGSSVFSSDSTVSCA